MNARSLLLLFAFAILFGIAAYPGKAPVVHAATLTVSNTNDAGAGSLRQAMLDAEDGDEIVFDDALGVATITLDGAQLPEVTQKLTINGEGRITIDANKGSRHFEVISSGTLTLDGLTVVNGRASGTFPDAWGGAIYASGGKASLVNSTLTGNEASGRGGAIHAGENSEVTITSTTLWGNDAGFGGAVSVEENGEVTIANSTLSDNDASYGGAIFNYGPVTITNSTLSGNDAEHFGRAIRAWSSVTLANTIVAGGPNLLCSVAIPDGINGTHNLIEDSSCGSLNEATDDDVNGNNILNGNADLGELQDNGGPTETHALGVDSDAINAGNNDAAVDPDNDPLEFDQRGPGFDRIVGDTVDIGSVEVQFVLGGSDVVESLFDGTLVELQGNGTCDLREAIQAALDDESVGECDAPSAGIITFADELLSAEGLVTEGTITLTAGQFPTITGATVDISGEGRITLDANESSRHFEVGEDGALALEGLTLVDGSAGSGGAIFSVGDLTITDSTLSRNDAGNLGGAIYNLGNGTVTDSTLSDNSAGLGGAIYSLGNGTVTNSTLSGNNASVGGAIHLNHSGAGLTITNSTLSGNATNNERSAIVLSAMSRSLTPSSRGGRPFMLGGPRRQHHRHAQPRRGRHVRQPC